MDKMEKLNPRKELVKQLSRELENQFVVADRPDHPFLLMQPDVIVGGLGLLTALFIPSASELTSPQKLLARLTLSRLALPAHTKCLLIIDPEKPVGKINDEAPRHFHETLEVYRLRNLISFIKDPETSKRIKMVPPDIRKEAFEKYTVVMKESIHLMDQSKPPFEPYKLIDELADKGYVKASSSQIIKNYEQNNTSEHFHFYNPESLHRIIKDKPSYFEANKNSAARKPRQPKVTWMHNEGTIIALFNRKAKVDKLRDIISVGTRINYKLDDGIPYSSREAKVNIIALDEVPISRIDPEKPIRAGAFAGWILIRPSSVNEIEEKKQIVAKNLREVVNQ